MSELSDELLIDSYMKAVQLNLDKEFIQLLHEEVEKRDFTHSFIAIEHQSNIKRENQHTNL